MEISCPCQTDIQACCACVSIHCDECHKPNRSKFVQGRFCSNCGRPLKAELTRAYVPKSEVDRLELTLQGVMWSVDKWLDEADYDADPVKRAITMREKTLRIIENAKSEVAREIFEEIEKILIDSTHIPDCARFVDIDKLAELKKKYTEG